MTTVQQPIIFNPLDPAFRSNPYPIYRRLLEEEPVHQTMFGVKAFSRYEDVLAILKDHKHFSSDDRKSPLYRQTDESYTPVAPSENVTEDDRPFLFMDPPDHTRLRRLVNTAFTPRAIEAMRPRIQQIVNELLDAAAAKGEMDIIADLAYPLPVKVICEMLGVPPDDESEFRGWSRVLASSLDPDLVTPPDVIKAREAAVTGSREYFRRLVAERRKALRDDILSALISAEEEGDKLTEGELLSTCTLILIAGHETTVNLIGNGVLQLLRHPDQLAKFQADPDLGPSVVEEVLRFDPPVQFDGRICMEETTVAGTTIATGEFVMQLLGAANRDANRFPDPDTFDITRNDSGHLAFGHGIHFCLGAPLARQEGVIALKTLAQRFPKMRLLTDTPVYKPQITLRGLESLPVALA